MRTGAGNVLLWAVFNFHAALVHAGRAPEQMPQVETQYINQVVAKVERLLMLGSGSGEVKFEVFEPHPDVRPPSRKRRRRKRRRRRHLLDEPPDLSLELPAFGHTLRLDLDQASGARSVEMCTRVCMCVPTYVSTCIQKKISVRSFFCPVMTQNSIFQRACRQLITLCRGKASFISKSVNFKI